MSEPLKLHLGCFDCAVPGWINTDISPHIWIARVPLAAFMLRRLRLMGTDRYEQHRNGRFRRVRYLDVTRRFPYADGTFSAVFSAHLLEHLFPDDAARCLKESWRVLIPGGICRVVVPDLDRMVAGYDPAAPGSFLRQVFEISDRRSIKNVHHWHYNERSLRSLLEAAGFRHVYRCSYKEGACPDLDRLDNRPDESLYVEARK